MGGDAAFYVRTADIDNVSGAAVIRCNDAGRALSIVEEKDPPAPIPEPRTLEELRLALLAQMEEFGLTPFDLTEPIGVANRKAGTKH